MLYTHQEGGNVRRVVYLFRCSVLVHLSGGYQLSFPSIQGLSIFSPSKYLFFFLGLLKSEYEIYFTFRGRIWMLLDAWGIRLDWAIGRMLLRFASGEVMRRRHDSVPEHLLRQRLSSQVELCACSAFVAIVKYNT